MLPDIAAEALQFLSRRDLDKACAVSKWLDGMIAHCCPVYPLRPVLKVELTSRSDWESELPMVLIHEEGNAGIGYSHSSIDESVSYGGSVLRHSYVETLQMYGEGNDIITLVPRHWTTLIDAIRCGTVRSLRFFGVDFSALDDDTFLVAGCRGLQSLVVHRSILPNGFAMDDLIRSSAARRLRELSFSDIKDAPRLSDDAVMDFMFTSDATPGGQSRKTTLEHSRVTELYLAKLFKRLLSSSSRPSGSLTFYDAAEQRGLSAYANYLAPTVIRGVVATYRFPSVDDDNKSYEVMIRQRPTYRNMRCSFVCNSD